ncbi:MAG TPA: hypothetical protein VF665_11480 [Longimicrobium sp.]|jgi:hypothetical protein|uniref:hypothetical protein n=1 Tax=Longimicrobium sp. TaxID=2029185 RepID=UPI002ED9D95B
MYEAKARLSAQWARIGGGFTVAPHPEPVDVERLVSESAAAAPQDHRLFFVAATWLGVHHHLVDVRRLGRELEVLSGVASAAAGAMLSVANLAGGSPRLESVARHCAPLAEPRPLFDRIGRSPVLREAAREGSHPAFTRWGLWNEDVSLKTDAVRPVRWILAHCPELRVRALLGAGLDAEIVRTVLDGPRTVAAIARATGATYASAHEAAARLAARGILDAPAPAGRGVALSPAIRAWLDAFPGALRPA